MTATASVTRAEVGDAGSSQRAGWRARLSVVAVVAVAASPILIAAVSLRDRSWFPTGDWAGLVWRTSQVGTRDTPLVGFDSVKGWAHPGPLLFWIADPLYRLMSGDPRSLVWTAAIINVAVVAALAAVAWRRGGWPLLLATMGFTAVLIHGISPERTVDLWVSHLPLLAFLLTVFLVWETALGAPSALLVAAGVASFTAQTHLAYVSLNAVLAVWLLAWCLRWPLLLPADDPSTAELSRPPWERWRTALRRAVVVALVLWIGPLLDAAFDLRNPWHIARSFGSHTPRIGLVQAVGLVGRYVRPDGPWMGGSEPTGRDFLSVQGSGALPLLLAVGVLVACLRIGQQRRLTDVVALTTLALSLMIGAIPAAAQIPVPNEVYYSQWLKVVGGLVWFTVAWTGWRLAEPAVRSVSARRVAAVALAGAVVVLGAGSSWGQAAAVDPPLEDAGRVVRSLDAQLRPAGLSRNEVIRVVRRGEYFHIYGAGVTYALLDAGYDVVTDEGDDGLKWGHAHRWTRGDQYDVLLTVAVNDSYRQCESNPRARLLAGYDELSPEDRAWLSDLQLRRLSDPESVAPEEIRRNDALAPHDLRVGVFESPSPCSRDAPNAIDRTTDGSILPVVGGAVALLLGAAGVRHLVHRRRKVATGAPARSER
jgi:hypothetical protein